MLFFAFEVVSQLEVDEIGTLLVRPPNIGELSLIESSTVLLNDDDDDNIKELTLLKLVVGPCLSITDVAAAAASEVDVEGEFLL
jgi:hypothetical protein